MKTKTVGTLVVVLLGVFLYIIINIGGNRNSNHPNEHKAKNKTETFIQYIDTEELQKQKETVNTLKEQFSNLNLKETQFIFPEVQFVYRLSIKGVYPYQNETDVWQLVEKELEFIRHYRQEELDEEDLFDCGNGISYQEMQEDIKQDVFFEKHKEYPSLVYSKDVSGAEEIPYFYTHVFADFNTIWFDKGKIYALLDQKYSGEPDSVCRVLEEYSINAMENKEYTLADGKIMIAEAVAFVEKYFRDQLPYETNPEVDMKVQNVKVLEVTGDISALQFQITRSYGGIPFEADGLEGSTTDIATHRKDRAMAFMVEKGDIDVYCGTDNGNTDMIEKTGEEIRKIISAESALNIISDEIGSNSDYDILKMEIVYRRKIVNQVMMEGTEYIGIPCWKITGKNNTDGKETYFYVGLQDGELSYTTRK